MGVLAGARRALELRAAAAEARGSSFPHFLRTHVVDDCGEWSDPSAAAHRHIVCNSGPHPDLATALEVNRANVQALPRPPRRLDVAPGLDGHIVLDGDQIQGS